MVHEPIGGSPFRFRNVLNTIKPNLGHAAKKLSSLLCNCHSLAENGRPSQESQP
jgi:hypothetical protein